MTLLVLLMSLALQDTTVVVQGLLVQVPSSDGSGAWLLALPTPFRFRDRLIAELELGGESGRWHRFGGHYVEARGTLSMDSVPGLRPRGGLRIAAVREVDPEGTARKNVSGSFTHRASMVLWVLPHRFAWLDAAGQPTGVGPAIVYTLNNHGESDVTLEFESKDFACFSVEPRNGGAPPWTFTRRLSEPTDRQQVTLPKFVREVARLPREAAPEPGRYVVRAGLCGFTEYQLETEIEVVR
jgi:hypothetical protein